MASGDTLATFFPSNNEPPSSNPARWDLINRHPVLRFDDTVNESAVFTMILLRAYGGGGLTVYIHYDSNPTSNTVDWDMAFERIGDQQQDIDSDGFASAQVVDNTTVPSPSGLVDIVNIVFTDGAQIDSIAVGEMFRMKLTRDAVSDDASGDINVLGGEIKET